MIPKSALGAFRNRGIRGSFQSGTFPCPRDNLSDATRKLLGKSLPSLARWHLYQQVDVVSDIGKAKDPDPPAASCLVNKLFDVIAMRGVQHRKSASSIRRPKYDMKCLLRVNRAKGLALSFRKIAPMAFSGALFKARKIRLFSRPHEISNIIGAME